MNQIEFEKLVLSMINVKRSVVDSASLLQLACELLDGEMAVLLQLQEGGRYVVYQPVGVFPAHNVALIENNIDTLRGWYRDAKLSFCNVNIPGYANEGQFDLAAQQFADILVVFGEEKRNLLHHELILLKKAGTTGCYSSYHCWAADQLLRQFQVNYLQEMLLNKEKQEKQQCLISLKQYAGSLNTLMLPDEPWEGLKSRMQDKNPGMRYLSYIIWTAYQIRKSYLGKPTASGFDMSGLDNAFQQTDSDNIFRKLIDFFTSSNRDYKLEAIDYKTLSELFKELLADPEKLSSLDITEVQFYQVVALFLEQAWRLIYHNTLMSERRLAILKRDELRRDAQTPPTDLKILMESTRSFLRLTSALIVRVLTSSAVNKVEEIDAGDEWSNHIELGRNFLRLYFVVEIAKESSRLEQLYLGASKDRELREAPAELKRSFIFNLGRFILSILGDMQERLNLWVALRPVSPSEEIDSLLYLVDRFVHVELQVDERLNLRDLLSRQIDAEVQHHLKLPHYRDHLLHVIDVFLLGYLWLNTQIRWLQEEKSTLLDHLGKITFQSTTPTPANQQEWLQNWAVASLLHDIGYQIGHGRSVSKEPEVWNEFFALDGPANFEGLEFSWDGAIAPGSNRDGDPFKFLTALKDKIKKDTRVSDCMPSNLEDKSVDDHGLISAFRLFQFLCHASYGDDQSGGKDIVKDFSHALHAIAHHNLCHCTVNLNSHPLSCLLRLCDELQEWNRRRINVERVLKHLYLDFQGAELQEGKHYEMFQTFKSNLYIQAQPDEGLPQSLLVSLPDDDSFKFLLIYRDSVEGNFDPIMSLLNKAYNLQHINLAVEHHGYNDLKFSIEIRFTCPPEYGAITEYDIYGLFTQEVRSLPLLWEFATLDKSEAGLVRLANRPGLSKEDRFGIIVAGISGSNRKGWIQINPGNFFRRFIAFKEDVLRSGTGKIITLLN